MMSTISPLRIAYYVSGHGFGHSTRAYAVIAQLLAHQHKVAIITSAPKFIFQDLLEGYPYLCEFRAIEFESGVTQSDAVTVDAQTTMTNLNLFVKEKLSLVSESEETWMVDWRPHVVCSDAAYVPLEISKKLDIPSAIVSNFTFDEIYEALVHSKDNMQLVDLCKSLYSNADLLLRLPGFINIPSFTERPQKIIDLPLVVRKSRILREDVRRILNVSFDAKIVLITFGGHELSKMGRTWEPADILPAGWTGVVISPGNKLKLDDLPSPTGSRPTEDGRLIVVRSEDWYMPDLINASDVVLSKCGYGMCSEVVAHQKPLIYVPRPLFVEEKGLLKNMMEPYGHALEMSPSVFYQGKWTEYIEQAAALIDHPPQKDISLNGDLIACRYIVELALERFDE